MPLFFKIDHCFTHLWNLSLTRTHFLLNIFGLASPVLVLPSSALICGLRRLIYSGTPLVVLLRFITASLLPTFWTPGQWKNLSRPDWHLFLDVLPSPKTEPCQDRAALHPSQILHETQELFMTVNGTVVAASHSVRNLCVTLNDNLDFKKHIGSTTQSCRYVHLISRGYAHFWPSPPHSCLSRP